MARSYCDLYSSLWWYSSTFINRTKKRLSNAGQNINLPDVSHVHTHSDHVKPIFILNLQLSSESPSLFFNEDDGPGYSLVFYFMITEVSYMLSLLTSSFVLPDPHQISDDKLVLLIYRWFINFLAVLTVSMLAEEGWISIDQYTCIVKAWA